MKVYNNMYFDPQNANIVQLASEEYSSGNTGGNVKSLQVISRDSTSAIYKPGDKILPSATAVISSAYTNYTTMTNLNSSMSASSTVAGLFYISWKHDTFLHVLDKNTKKFPYTALSAYIPGRDAKSPSVRYYDANASSPNTLGSSFPVSVNDIGSSTITSSKDGSLYVIPHYDPSKNVYQLCTNVFFDMKNGSLILFGDNSINVYNRPSSLSTPYVDPRPVKYPTSSGTTPKNTSITMSSLSYYPYYAMTPDDNFIILYIATGQNTVLGVVSLQNGVYQLSNVQRFLANGTVDNNGNIVTPLLGEDIFQRGRWVDGAWQFGDYKGWGGAWGANNGDSYQWGQNGSWDKNTGPDSMSDYYQWLAFWNTVANSSNPASTMKASNMIAKTSAVPPVCPVCPNCANCTGNGGVCTSCGGQGGAGLQGSSNSGSSNSGSSNSGSSNSGPSANQIVSDTGSGTKQLLEEAGSGATSLVRDAGSAGASGVQGAANMARDTVTGAVGLAKDTVGGAVGLAKDTVGGAVGLAKDTVGGTIGLAKEAGSSVAGLFQTNPTQLQGGPGQGGPGQGGPGQSGPGIPGQGGQGGQGTQSGPGTRGIPGIDPYSHYGALVAQPSNFIPITTDFSAFGR